MPRQLKLNRAQARAMGLEVARTGKLPPPIIEGLIDTGEPAFTGGSRPGYTTHRLEKPVRCPDCGAETRDLFQKIDGVKLGRAVCEQCDGTKERKKR